MTVNNNNTKLVQWHRNSDTDCINMHMSAIMTTTQELLIVTMQSATTYKRTVRSSDGARKCQKSGKDTSRYNLFQAVGTNN